MFYSFLLILFGLVLYYFDLYSTIFCDENDDSNGDNDVKSKTEDRSNDHYEFKLPKKVVDNTVDVLAKIVSNVTPNIGAAAAAGTIGSTTLKLTNGLPPIQRAAAMAGSAFVGAVATTSGIKTGNALFENSRIKDAIEKSEYGNAFKNDERPPSPDNNIIQSIFENENNIPLFDLLEGIFTFNFLELILMLLLILLSFNRYFYRFNFKFFYDFIDKRFAENSKFYVLKKLLKTGDNYNSRFTNILIVIMITLLLTIKLVNLFFIGELVNNIDDYILVYNHIKKN